jgi:hypothetical protein
MGISPRHQGTKFEFLRELRAFVREKIGRVLGRFLALGSPQMIRTNRRRQRDQRLRQAHEASEKLNPAGPVA